jgi:very-short-patch-repair endonuclease
MKTRKTLSPSNAVMSDLLSSAMIKHKIRIEVERSRPDFVLLGQRVVVDIVGEDAQDQFVNRTGRVKRLTEAGYRMLQFTPEQIHDYPQDCLKLIQAAIKMRKLPIISNENTRRQERRKARLTA